jgi:N-acyl-D-aspartate/D-glutamate deacylase
LGKLVREERWLKLEEAIRKMTSLPAQKLRLKDRGLIKEGMEADVVIFDRKKIKDRATYKSPSLYPEGIEYVLVNGQIVVEKGEHSGAFPGRVLRRSSSES